MPARCKKKSARVRKQTYFYAKEICKMATVVNLCENSMQPKRSSKF